MKEVKLPIYFDNQATSPVDKRVFDAMYPYFMQDFGNAHSITHSFGEKASKAVEKAREEVASVINAKTKDIIWTSGATESNNIAIKGVARAYKSDTKNHIITVATEHKCVLESVKSLKKEGFNITILPVQHDGLISLDDLKNEITDKTILVSVMGVNNEIGVIQPLKEIGKICKEKGVIFHSDCAQAFGKIPLDIEDMNIDLMSISGHKIYAPKGIGALYINTKIKVQPLFSGGGQEKRIRSGTLAVPLIVGMGVASKLCQKEMTENSKKMKKMFDILHNEMMKIEKCYLNGSIEHRYFGNANYSFAGIEGESIMIRTKEVAVSSGSACTSSDLQPSYVIKALGGDPELAHSSLRISFGRFNTEEEVRYYAKKLVKEVEYLRNMSCLWDQIKVRDLKN